MARRPNNRKRLTSTKPARQLGLPANFASLLDRETLNPSSVEQTRLCSCRNLTGESIFSSEVEPE
jgi:hypothetical protein